ncbi:MAG TPA: SigB/SigF/SigG family RNA polymerase sigma factor [Acidimicrobiales bacterium]|nr:SigB/SigF/SigG family RNA polymerase sigma factor [Acidimicrobiales bacterium]
MSSHDDSVLERFRDYRRHGERSIRNSLVEEHRWIALRCARRFEGRGEPLDDLIQVAQLGVLKAVERFDPDHGAAFPSFAMPTVMGELRRHFRDRTWSVGVPRRLKELHVSLGRAVERLNHTLGRQPTVEELATELRVTPDEVLEALDAGAAYRTTAITRPDDDTNREPAVLGEEDSELAHVDSRMAVRRLLGTLGPRERTIVYLRFFGSLTQQEIAERLGMSQVHVSRLLRQCLSQLESALEDESISENGV